MFTGFIFVKNLKNCKQYITTVVMQILLNKKAALHSQFSIEINQEQTNQNGRRQNRENIIFEQKS